MGLVLVAFHPWYFMQAMVLGQVLQLIGLDLFDSGL